MDSYLDSLEERIRAANTCKALQEAAAEAMESLQQAIDDAQEQMTALEPLLVPPVTLPGVILWIKAMIDTIVTPYKLLMEQMEMYAARLARLQQLLADKAAELACMESTVQEMATSPVPPLDVP